MCPISPGQANNDWKAIEVKQTDSIQLVIAVFASLSTCEEVGGKTQHGCHFSFCLHLPRGTPAEFLPLRFLQLEEDEMQIISFLFFSDHFLFLSLLPLFDIDLSWPRRKILHDANTSL